MFDIVLILSSLAGSSSQSAESETYALGQSIYVPNTDLLGSLPSGVHLFSSLQERCMQNQPLQKSARKTDYYRDTASTYSSIATATGLQANFETDFSFGVTLDVITGSISGKERKVSGFTLQLSEKAYILFLSKDCLLQGIPSPQFIDEFHSLRSNIGRPWLYESWREYRIFLNTWGTHIITGVTRGLSSTLLPKKRGSTLNGTSRSKPVYPWPGA